MNTTTATPAKISTIDIKALSWFDKVNGNSYFAAIVTIDYGTPNEKEIKLPFQYGYGDQYEYEAGNALDESGIITLEKYQNGSKQSLWRYCEENEIILRKNKRTGCKKSELKNI
jgi:hypothetical protein